MLSLPDAKVEDVDGDDEVVSKEAVGLAIVRYTINMLPCASVMS